MPRMASVGLSLKCKVRLFDEYNDNGLFVDLYAAIV